VAYNRYDEAFRAIHSALNSLTASPPGRRITKLAFTWNADGTMASLRAYDGDDLLFTLAFTWNLDSTLKEVART
jgi:hypothetical protein